MKGVLIILFSMCVAVCFGQLKHDANWVFGERCGIDFGFLNNPTVFYPASNNNETTASISNKDGRLALYLSCPANYLGHINNGSNDTIVNGDNINVHFSASNGAVFLPISEDSIFLFHAGFEPNCGWVRCLRLYKSLIVRNSLGNWEVVLKNSLMLNNPIEESIALVKHSDGKSWWLYAHEERAYQPDSCSNKYFYFQIHNADISGPNVQITLGDHCGGSSFGGEMSISKTGKLLFRAVFSDGKVFIYYIDRCDGKLNLTEELTLGPYTYSVASIDNYLYVGETNLDSGAIYQYNLNAPNVNATKKLLYNNNVTLASIGQMETNGERVLVSMYYIGNDSLLKRKFQRHLSIIEFANTDSARIRHEYIYLGDSAKTSYGLPNFPNYNLGPDGVFLANAGKDTVLCSNTNSTGVIIGVPPVPNITYLWQPATGLSATYTAQPTANPTQSTWYYLTATDTTATSCAVNTDSVYVEVRTCTGITETPTLQAKLYPNPTNGLLTIEVPQGTGGYTFRLFNLLGQQVLEYPLEHDKTTVPLDFAKGIYLYQITANNGQVQFGKLVVE